MKVQRSHGCCFVLVCLFYLLYRTAELFIGDDGDDSGDDSDEEPGGLYQHGVLFCAESDGTANGILGDKFHPGKMIFTGLAIAAGANLCMGFAGGFQVMAVIWGINGYAQAMIWPPIIRIFAEMVSREQKMKFCVDIVSSQVLGTLASYLLAAGVMWLIGWRAVFGAAAICLGAMSVVWIIGFGKIENCGKDPERDAAEVDKRGKDSSVKRQTAGGKTAWSVPAS